VTSGNATAHATHTLPSSHISSNIERRRHTLVRHRFEQNTAFADNSTPTVHTTPHSGHERA
jgi:hypothetical protein